MRNVLLGLMTTSIATQAVAYRGQLDNYGEGSSSSIGELIIVVVILAIIVACCSRD